MPPLPPRRDPPGGLLEHNVSRAPHTPVPPRDTAPPPVADPRPPPVEYRARRAPVVAPPLSAPTAPSLRDLGPGERTIPGLAPAREKMDTGEQSSLSLLQALAQRGQEARDARTEADELRRLLVANSVHRLPQVEAARGSLPPKKSEWVKAVFGLLGALTLALGGLGTYLGARAASQESTVSRVEAKTDAQTTATTDLAPRVLELERQNRTLVEWAREYADYDRQIFARLGVTVPRPIGAPPSAPIDVTARVRRTNVVTSAPILEVNTQPPALP